MSWEIYNEVKEYEVSPYKINKDEFEQFNKSTVNHIKRSNLKKLFIDILRVSTEDIKEEQKKYLIIANQKRKEFIQEHIIKSIEHRNYSISENKIILRNISIEFISTPKSMRGYNQYTVIYV